MRDGTTESEVIAAATTIEGGWNLSSQVWAAGTSNFGIDIQVNFG